MVSLRNTRTVVSPPQVLVLRSAIAPLHKITRWEHLIEMIIVAHDTINLPLPAAAKLTLRLDHSLVQDLVEVRRQVTAIHQHMYTVGIVLDHPQRTW